jgi:hypothetical protein
LHGSQAWGAWVFCEGDMNDKPTIAELEAILDDPRPHEVYILPDGQVRSRLIGWQPPETAPSGERVCVWHPDWHRGIVLFGIHHSKQYHNRGRTGWRISFNPGDKWTWIQGAPEKWCPLPYAPRDTVAEAPCSPS